MLVKEGQSEKSYSPIDVNCELSPKSMLVKEGQLEKVPSIDVNCELSQKLTFVKFSQS